MPTRFAEAVRDYVASMYAPDGVSPEHRGEADYATDPKRLDEADRVAPLVEGFASAELLGTGKGLGIYGFNMIPSVGQQLGRRLRKADEAQHERALEAIGQAMAVGYVAFISGEDRAGIHFNPD